MAVVLYRLHEVALDEIQPIAVEVLSSMVGFAVRDVIVGPVVSDAATVVVPVPPPPPPHEARPESASSKTKYAPASRSVVWVVLRSAMGLPDLKCDFDELM